jgi:hypothetical protein
VPLWMMAGENKGDLRHLSLVTTCLGAILTVLWTMKRRGETDTENSRSFEKLEENRRSRRKSVF